MPRDLKSLVLASRVPGVCLPLPCEQCDLRDGCHLILQMRKQQAGGSARVTAQALVTNAVLLMEPNDRRWWKLFKSPKTVASPLGQIPTQRQLIPKDATTLEN